MQNRDTGAARETEVMIKRLFAVAEILSRKQAHDEPDAFCIESCPEKSADEEIEYSEINERSDKAGSG
jgi:hypothetical protein